MAAPVVSLVVGNDTLGYQELGADAILGTMTKGMPGGDGSLDFTLVGDAVEKYRNVLVPIDSKVVLRINGEPIWGGFILSDPVRHRISAQDSVTVDCCGQFAVAARDGSYGYIGRDTDLDQWHQYRNKHDHSGKFTVQKEEWIELRGIVDRNFATDDAAAVYYWIHDGLTSGSGTIFHFHFEYKLRLPTGWRAAIWSGNSGPVSTDPGAGAYTWEKTSADSPVATWTDDLVAATPGHDTILIKLWCHSYNAQTNNPYLLVRNVRVTGDGLDSTWTPGIEANNIGDVLRIVSFNSSPSPGFIDPVLDGLVTGIYDEFVSRYPTTRADTLLAAGDLYGGPLELFFDLDPEGVVRFNGRIRPEPDNLWPGNRRWVVGGRGGEDISGLLRDSEMTPDYVEVVYSYLSATALTPDPTCPDGTVRKVDYPTGSPAYTDNVEVIDLASDAALMTPATASKYAQAIYENRQSRLYTGSVVLADTAHTVTGISEPTYRLRPGDRITALDLDDTDLFGDPLYVVETSYDFGTMTATATIGEPWEPDAPEGSSGRFGRRHRRKKQYKTRRGIA